METYSKVVKNRRYYMLDSIRGVSALLVVLYHYTTRYESLFSHKEKYAITFPYGRYAVLIFFLISGYLAVRNIEEEKPLKYVIKRFFRLYPIYWVAILITMPLVVIFLPSRSVSIMDMLLNFTMLQTIFGAENVDGAYWTLFCELTFYFMIFTVIVLKKQKKVAKLILLWALFQVVLFVLPDTEFIIKLNKVNTMIYGHCFMAGATISCIEKDIQLHLVSFRKYIIIMLHFIVLIFCISEQFILHDLQSGVFFVFSVILVCFAIYSKEYDERLKFTVFNRSLSFIGAISYPLYLLHQNIGYIIIIFMEKIGMNSVLFILVPISVLIIISYILHKYVEVPMSKFSNIICSNL